MRRPRHDVRAAAVDLNVLVVLAADEPAQLARLGGLGMFRVEPRTPIADQPEAFRPGRRVRGAHDAAALTGRGRAVPGRDEFVLRLGEVRELVEAVEVLGAALAALLVVLELAAA